LIVYLQFNYLNLQIDYDNLYQGQTMTLDLTSQSLEGILEF